MCGQYVSNEEKEKFPLIKKLGIPMADFGELIKASDLESMLADGGFAYMETAFGLHNISIDKRENHTHAGFLFNIKSIKKYGIK